MLPANLRPIADVVLVTGRPYRTVQTWVRRGRIRAASDIETRQLLVSLTDAQRLAGIAEDRTRRAA